MSRHRSVVAAAALALAITCPVLCSEAPPTAHWAFDSTGSVHAVRDLTGHGHDAVIVRSARLEGPVEPKLIRGMRGQALVCGGSGQYGYFANVAVPPTLSSGMGRTFVPLSRCRSKMNSASRQSWTRASRRSLADSSAVCACAPIV